MAKFAVKIHRVQISRHPNADRLEIARIGGYECCVGKHTLKTGDLAAYVPDGALVPQTLLAEMNLQGKLAGTEQNRVRPILLRGVLSQGLVVPPTIEALRSRTFTEGDDVTALLRIVKYEPTPPPELFGTTLPAHADCLDFDIEDVQAHPNIIEPGEEVVITEKLHGVMTCLAITGDGEPLVTSKGLGHKGLKFDTEAAENATNLHVAMWRRHKAGVEQLHAAFGRHGDGVYVLGETSGGKLQDLSYGMAKDERAYRAFDVFIGDRRQGHWLSPDDVTRYCIAAQIDCVPEIARIPYDAETVAALATGRSLIDTAWHAREGVVVRLATERTDPAIGRVILKIVARKHLVRRNATELS